MDANLRKSEDGIEILPWLVVLDCPWTNEIVICRPYSNENIIWRGPSSACAPSDLVIESVIRLFDHISDAIQCCRLNLFNVSIFFTGTGVGNPPVFNNIHRDIIWLNRPHQDSAHAGRTTKKHLRKIS